MLFNDVRKKKRGKIEIQDGNPDIILPVGQSKKWHDVVQGTKKEVRVSQEIIEKKLKISPLKKNINRKNQPQASEKIGHWSLPQMQWTNPLAAFGLLGAAVLVLMVSVLVVSRSVSLKDSVKTYATDAIAHLADTKKNLENFNLAAVWPTLEQAQRSFAQAQNELLKISNFVRFLQLPDTDLAAVYQLYTLASKLSTVGEEYGNLGNNMGNLFQELGTQDWEKLKKKYPKLTDVLFANYQQLQTADQHLATLETELDTTNLGLLPASLQDMVSSVKDNLHTAVNLSRNAEDLAHLGLDFLGYYYPRKYLILLQNQDEIRPTGGFIGSMIFVNVQDGWITDLSFKDVYDFDGQMKETIPAPAGLKTITDQYFLRDSNYYPDFPTSGREIIRMLQKEGGPSVDGVLAINQSLIVDLLKLTGPVKIAGQKMAFDSSNFTTLLSYIVEAKLTKEHPKEILGQLIPAFLDMLKNADLVAVADTVLNQIQDKQIAFYSPVESLQSGVEKLGLTGQMTAAASLTQDYLLIANTSVAGNKSDHYVTQKIHQETFINTIGIVTDRLHIERLHSFNSHEEKKITSIIQGAGLGTPSEALKTILGKGENVSYMRVYVPLGTTLLDSIGIPVEQVSTAQENGKTVFSFYMSVMPDNNRKITLVYQPPIQLNLDQGDTYKILVEKPVGEKNQPYQESIATDDDVVLQKSFPAELASPHSFHMQTDLTNSLFFSALLGRKP